MGPPGVKQAHQCRLIILRVGCEKLHAQAEILLGPKLFSGPWPRGINHRSGRGVRHEGRVRRTLEDKTPRERRGIRAGGISLLGLQGHAGLPGRTPGDQAGGLPPVSRAQGVHGDDLR